MSTWTMRDIRVCQGHNTCYDNRCQWEDCDGHGTVSYCDDTCDSATRAWATWLESHPADRPAPTTDRIVLEFTEANTRNPARWTVRFEGPDAEAWALAYVTARWSTHAVYELPEEPFSYQAYPLLADKLYPLCEHGLSADLCEGPDHYMTRDQEMARGW